MVINNLLCLCQPRIIPERLTLLLLLVFLLPGVLPAQPGALSSSNRKAVKQFEEGRDHMNRRDKESASAAYRRALTHDPAFFEAHVALAEVSLDLQHYDTSIVHYRKAITLNPDRLPVNYYNLAVAEMEKELYEEAILHLEKFLSYPKTAEETRRKAEQRLSNARFAVVAVKNPLPFAPLNMGEAINSPHHEYHPSFTVDENLLIFTRMRPRDRYTETHADVEEDFYTSTRVDGGWQPAVPLGPPINTHNNEGAHCISPDGRFFFYTGCNRPGGLGSCDLYISEKNGNTWNVPVNMGRVVNSSYWDSQPTVSADGRTLVFVSSRPGGKGSTDLWISRLQENGQWGEPENMGEVINTPYEEYGPFLHPDGQTLFFSSAGHPGMGKKDLFYSKLNNDNAWTTPVNLGYPINTKADEEYLVVSAGGTKGYFSSDREGGFGKRDIYVFDLPRSLRPDPVTYLEGKIRHSKTGNPVSAQFEIIDLATGKIRAMSRSDKVTGDFLVSLPSGGSYALNVHAPGYLFYSGNYTLDKTLRPTDRFQASIRLIPIETGASIVLKNVFFESGSSALRPESRVELEKLAGFLTQNPSVRIEIGGHTDSVGDDASNLRLSEERAKAVLEFIMGRGIASSRLVSKGYGETKPLADNATEEGRGQNRRTEFTVVAK